MKGKYDYFVPENYPEFLDTCKRFLSLSEAGTIITAPYAGIEQRIDQMIQNHSGLFDLPIVHIRLGPSIEDFEDIKALILKRGYSLETPLYIVLSQNEYPVESINTSFITNLVGFCKSRRKFGLLFIFETDITNPTRTGYLGTTSLLANISYYPLLSFSDAEKFIEKLEAEWRIKIYQKTARGIVQLFGGNMWLLKQAVRLIRDHPAISLSEISTHSTILFRLERIIDLFSKPERDTLTSFSKGQDSANDHEMQYFQRIGLLQDKKITIPALSQYLSQSKKRVTISCKKGKLYSDSIHITDLFSPKEAKVLGILVKNKSRSVSREAIGDLLWGDDENGEYSPWAIEQIIKRLRSKLAKAGFSKNCITTIRSVGYQYE